MFVLKNTMAQLGHHKVRTFLICLVALLVSIGSVFSLAVLHEYNTAHGATYDAQQPNLVIRPSGGLAEADKNGADADSTNNYMSWSDYNTIAESLQSYGVSYDSYAAAVSIPVRTTGDVQAIDTERTQDMSDQNKTGGNLMLQSFSDATAAAANEYGSIKLVDGTSSNELNYTDYAPTSNLVLVSKQFAQKNDLKVGSKFTIAAPNDANSTTELEVTGIYEYTSNPFGAAGDDGDYATYAKDDRNNVIYCSYATFSVANFDNSDATGWAKPDVNIIFSLTSPSAYETFKTAVEKIIKANDFKQSLTVYSPSLTQYNDSLKPLDTAATKARITLAVACSVAGVLLILLVLLAVIPRRDEIGNALLLGVTKGRLGWQFMLETFFPVWVGVIIGTIIGAVCANPLGTSMAGGHTIPMSAGVVWHWIWISFLASVVLALIGLVRVACFNVKQLFVSPYAVDPGHVADDYEATEAVVEADAPQVAVEHDDAVAPADLNHSIDGNSTDDTKESE